MSTSRATVAPCQFQPEGVSCQLPRECAKCGWNPKVAQQRLTRITYEKMRREACVE